MVIDRHDAAEFDARALYPQQARARRSASRSAREAPLTYFLEVPFKGIVSTVICQVLATFNALGSE